MRSLNLIFDKVLVYPFYRAHTVAFFFSLLVLFGAVEVGQLKQVHYAILVLAFSSVSMLSVFIGIWLLYMANAYHSILTYLTKPENQFIFQSSAQPRSGLLLCLTRLILLIDAPVLLYIVAGIGVGIHNSFWRTSIMATSFLILAVCAQVYWLFSKLCYTHTLPLWTFRVSLFNIRLRPSVFSIILRHLVLDRKIMLICVKLFSCALIYAAHYEWHSFSYDIRWMEVALSPAMAVQGVLMLDIFTFDIEYLSFTRGFPQSLWQRYLQILGLASLLLIPEACLLLSYTIHFGLVSQYPVLVMFMISFPVFHYAVLFTGDFEGDGYHSLLFALILVSFFACLFGLGWLLAGVFIIVSAIIFLFSYYSYEKKIKPAQ